MDTIVDSLMRKGWLGSGGVAVLIALSLLLAARLLLPREDRRLVHLPFFLLVLCGVAWAIALFYERDTYAGRLLRLAQLFLLLASMGKSSFLIVIHAVLAKRLSFPLPRIVQDIIQIGVYLGVALITLRAAGVEPGSLLATSALLTAVLGLSLQDTLGNMFAGLAIQAERPFQVGDWIQYDAAPEHVGEVTEINWRATRILTLDHVTITVPNGALAKSSIINFSRPEAITRRTTTIYAPYQVSPNRVKTALIQAAQETPGVLRMPPVTILTRGFSERGVEYSVRFFINNFRERETIFSMVNERLWYALSRLNVAIPVPRRHIEIEQLSDEQAQKRLEAEANRRLRVLEHVDFLKPLPRKLLIELADSAELRLYAPGEYIIHQGEVGEEMFIIERGKVGVVLERAHSERHVAELVSGQCFGEMSVMTGEPRSASILALVETEVMAVGKQAFKSIIEQNESVLEEMSEILAQRHHELSRESAEEESCDRKTQPAMLLNRIKSFFSTVHPPAGKG